LIHPLIYAIDVMMASTDLSTDSFCLSLTLTTAKRENTDSRMVFFTLLSDLICMFFVLVTRSVAVKSLKALIDFF